VNTRDILSLLSMPLASPNYPKGRIVLLIASIWLLRMSQALLVCNSFHM